MTTVLDVERADVHDLALDVHAQAAAAIAERGRFVVALAGGTTPGPLYRAIDRLAPSPGHANDRNPWNRWTALLTDERFLPVGHPDRNDRLLADTLPSLVAAGRLRTVPDEADPDVAAGAYARTVRDAGPLDLAILGLGADGHTAGVFDPPANHADRSVCVGVHDAPEPFRQRVTLTLSTLATARQAWFVVDGTDRSKDRAVERLRRDEGHAARVAGRGRTRLILLESVPSGSPVRRP